MFDFSWLSNPESWVALLTLVALELVLGVDNVIFISILSGKLPLQDQQRARATGIALAVITRILLLLSLSWIISLTKPFFHLPWFGGEQIDISGRDLILIVGGLFLLWKSTHEIHDKLEGKEGHASAQVAANFASVIIQIMLLDIVFSLDSVITAIGMVDHIMIMVIAVIVAAGVMIFTAKPIGDFVEHHPTIKILALSFLLLIGFTLIVEGLHQHISKGYVYFAMGFSVFVELINIRIRNKDRDQSTAPVALRSRYKESQAKLASALSAVKHKQTTSSQPAVPTGGAANAAPFLFDAIGPKSGRLGNQRPGLNASFIKRARNSTLRLLGRFGLHKGNERRTRAGKSRRPKMFCNLIGRHPPDDMLQTVWLVNAILHRFT